VPIPHGLVAKLEHAAAGRPADAPLLRSNGVAWGRKGKNYRRKVFREIVAALSLDPDVVTPYALRHSNVVRMIRAGTPIRIVASLHDSSIVMVEKAYSKHIVEHSDDIVRPALLSLETSRSDKVVALTKRRPS
jgi:hypothetical protein